MNENEKEMIEALKELFKNCCMMHRYGGSIDNSREADAAIARVHAAIAKTEERGKMNKKDVVLFDKNVARIREILDGFYRAYEDPEGKEAHKLLSGLQLLYMKEWGRGKKMRTGQFIPSVKHMREQFENVPDQDD